MSDAQIAWLDATLERTRALRHAFVFLHHPRWIGEAYKGGNWGEVHRRLRAAGNVRAVFAGHIHRLDHRIQDGIEYVTLGTTGGSKSHEFPAAGFLHHFDIVTVRPGGISLATIPVGATLDPRRITAERQHELVALAEGWAPRMPALPVDLGAADDALTVTLANPTGHPLEVTLVPRSAGEGWWLGPDHLHRTVPPRGEVVVELASAREAGALAATDRAPSVDIERALHLDGVRVAVPGLRWELPILLREVPPEAASRGVLRLDGDGDAVVVADAAIDLPDGPFTVEAWVRPADVARRRPIVAKTENSEYALSFDRGVPTFSVHLAGAYVHVEGSGRRLEAGRWTHIAGVFDGEEARLYVDGERAGGRPAKGARTRNAWPLCIGADPNARGEPTDFLAGDFDDIRLSRVARYRGERVPLPKEHAVDAETVLLLPCDADFGPFVVDRSGKGAHGLRRGDARSVDGGGPDPR
jgi:hypothetical protein